MTKEPFDYYNGYLDLCNVVEEWQGSSGLVGDHGNGDPGSITPRESEAHIHLLCRIELWASRTVTDEFRDIWTEQECRDILKGVLDEYRERYDPEYGRRHFGSPGNVTKGYIPHRGWRHYYRLLRFGTRYLDALYTPRKSLG